MRLSIKRWGQSELTPFETFQFVPPSKPDLKSCLFDHFVCRNSEKDPSVFLAKQTLRTGKNGGCQHKASFNLPCCALQRMAMQTLKTMKGAF